MADFHKLLIIIIVFKALATLLDRMAKPESVTIAIDGSLYKHHPRLDNLLKKYIKQFAPTREVKTHKKLTNL